VQATTVEHEVVDDVDRLAPGRRIGGRGDHRMRVDRGRRRRRRGSGRGDLAGGGERGERDQANQSAAHAPRL
jgi:hypothetical protein